MQGRGKTGEVAFDKLFTDNDGIKKVASDSTVLLGNIRAQESLFAQLLPGAAGNNACLFPLFDMGNYFFVEKFPETLPEDIMLCRVVNDVHQLLPPSLSGI